MSEQNTSSFIDTVVSVKRVTKVTKGGKQFSFSAFVVSGDQAGQVGIGVGKSREVSAAIAKAKSRARKTMTAIALRDTTIPYDVRGRHGATEVILRSAYKGTGLIAGASMRAVMLALGIRDILAKVIGPSRCGHNVVKATLNALSKGRTVQDIAQLRGRSITRIITGKEHAA